jgi:hypothetical protein
MTRIAAACTSLNLLPGFTAARPASWAAWTAS